MKRRKIVVTFLLAVGLMMTPCLGLAGMNPLSESQLGEVVGQAGVSMKIDNLQWNITIDTLAYGDQDGLGPESTTAAGYFSLCGIVFNGAARFTTPLTVDVVAAGIGSGMVGLTSLNMTMTAMTLQVDRLSIDAIRLGAAAGSGESLGSLYMSNLFASLSGNVQLSVKR
jgi:hypothetical protein